MEKLTRFIIIFLIAVPLVAILLWLAALFISIAVFSWAVVLIASAILSIIFWLSGKKF